MQQPLMEVNANTAASPPLSSVPDWDRPITQQEIDAIDAAILSAQVERSRIKPCHSDSGGDGSGGDCPKRRRRLPGSLAGSPTRSSPYSFSLSPCPKNRPFDFIYSSSRANLMRYPKMNFGGCIVYTRTVAEVEKAASELLEIVEAKRREKGRVIFGFDIEWRPTFKKGFPPGKAAVMQICGDLSHCYVMHIIHSGIPYNLRSLLEDPTSTKVGVGIANDSVKVFKDYNVSIKDCQDLSNLANQKLGGHPKNWSLKSLTDSLICKQLQKPYGVRLGNWEADILSKEQLQYAATDAFASWYIYQVLQSLPDAAVNESKDSDPPS